MANSTIYFYQYDTQWKTDKPMKIVPLSFHDVATKMYVLLVFFLRLQQK